jgi:hypothetical protein
MGALSGFDGNGIEFYNKWNIIPIWNIILKTVTSTEMGDK